MQTTFNVAPPRAFAGLQADSFPSGYISRALSTKQLVALQFGTTDGTYTVTINGVQVASYVASSASAQTIRDAIYTAIAASAAPVTVTKVSTNILWIEKNDFGVAFTISIPTIAGFTLTTLVAQGQVAPFGVGVVADDRAAVTGKQCRLPRQASDITGGTFLGVLAANTSKMPAGGWPAESMPDILRKGHIWVVAEGSGAEGQQLYCRYAAGAGGSQLGAFRADADSSTAAAVAGMRALEAWSASGIVLAEVEPQT